MKKNNILAILALSVFMVPVVGAMSHSGTVSDWFGVEVADTVLTDTGVQVTELSDSMKSVLEPQKRTLTGTELLPDSIENVQSDSTGNVLPDSTANVQKSTQTEGKKYGTVKGVVSYSNGEGIVNAKLEFASETDTILTTSLADGTFSIELLEGKYDLYVSYQEDKIKPVDVKVKAGETTEISKNKLEFDSKLLKEFEITAAKGRRRFNLHICNLAKLPLALAELEICTVPDTQKVKKVIYSDNDGNFSDSLLLGNYILRPKYLDYELDEIKVTVSNEDVNLDTIVVDNIKHLRIGEIMNIKSRDAMISLYKQKIGKDISAENYSRVYGDWREAFCARPDRYLVQYLDGITILNACIAADTIQKRYDRIKLYTEELMDLFELAIINIDSLNAQIAGEDTLTIAKLRAQQIEYFRTNWQMDTVFRSPVADNNNRKLVNNTNWISYIEQNGQKDSIKWDEELFRDKTMNVRLYNMSRDIVTSDDDFVEMKDVDVYTQAMFFKFRMDSARVGLQGAKSAFYADTTLTLEKARRVLAALTPEQMQAIRGINAVNFQRAINERFSFMSAWVVDEGDVDRLVEIYRRRWNTEGDDIVDVILGNKTFATSRDNAAAMELYYDALKNKNEREPSFDLMSNIINRALRLKKYNDVVNYTQKASVEPEFFDLSGYEQASMYVRAARVLEEMKGSTQQRYPWLKKAMQACPEYPDPYYYLARMIQNINLGNVNPLLKRFKFCVAYEQFEIAKQKFLAIEAMGDNTEVKSNLTVDNIKQNQANCSANFPLIDDVFMQGDNLKMKVGKPYTIKLPFGAVFTAIVRTQERTDE